MGGGGVIRYPCPMDGRVDQGWGVSCAVCRDTLEPEIVSVLDENWRVEPKTWEGGRRAGEAENSELGSVGKTVLIAYSF